MSESKVKRFDLVMSGYFMEMVDDEAGEYMSHDDHEELMAKQVEQISSQIDRIAELEQHASIKNGFIMSFINGVNHFHKSNGDMTVLLEAYIAATAEG